MIRIILLSLCAVVLASCTSSKRVHFLQEISGDSLKTKQVDLAEYEKKYSKYDGVFLESEQTLEHVGGDRSSWYFYKMRRLRFLVLNPDAEWLTTFKLDVEDGVRVDQIYINILSPDGTVRRYGLGDLKIEKSTGDDKVYKFAYPDIQKGSIIEEGYELRQNPYGDASILRHSIPLQFSVPCEHLSVTYAFPEWWGIQFKTNEAGETEPYKTTTDHENHKISVKYEASMVPAVEDEPYSPFFRELATFMEFMVTKLSMSPVTYASPASWSVFADDFKGYFIDKESFWSGKVGSTVDDLIEHKSSKYDRLDTIISYIQENIKVGSNRGNDNFADVLKNGEGNWYMITGLARAMLEKADIPADFLLIHSARDGYFDKKYISYDQLYLPAVSAVIDGRTYVVFPYIKHLPVDHIPDYIQGQTALKISGDGFNGFLDIPRAGIENSTVQETYDLTIDEDGNITVEEEKTLLGANAYSVRESLVDLKDDEIDKTMKELLTYSEGDVRLVSHEIVNQNDYKKPLVIKLRYTIDNLVTVTPEEVIFQTGGLFSPSSSQKLKVDTEERKNPIRIYYDERFTKNIDIHYPASWTLGTTLKDVQYENEFGSIKASYNVGAGECRVAQERVLKSTKESKDKINDLLAVTGRKSRLYIPTLIFQVKEEGN